MAGGESDAMKSLRRLRRDGRDEGDSTLVGYLDEAGNEVAWTGDGEGPYTEPLGRTSTTGVLEDRTEVTENGENQRLLVDEEGRLWMRPAPGMELTLYHSAALEEITSAFANGTVIYVKSIRAIIDTALNTDYFLQIIDGTPTVLWEAFIPAATGYAEVGDGWDDFVTFTGPIYLAISTTPGTYTAVGSDVAIFMMSYVDAP